MSPKTRSATALILVLAGLAVVAGIYGFRAGERKAASAVTTAAPATAITRAMATGKLAAFLVKPERVAVADIEFQNGDGKPVKLSDWRGRIVLVNLWATWCVPCRKEMPTLAALQAKLGSKDFEVVAISVDRKGLDVSGAFLKEIGATALKLYAEPTAQILNDLQALGLPATLLIDRQGREVGRLLGAAEWDSPEAVALIQAALAEPSS
ncbi:MAG: TlpA family protein disulfide reductase [Rhizobiales bacterium]|nr:TlpA family protein disulfide reductase [Hyphomicrobiales bacterium]MBI3673166.1 TlpA family protein disulfide reductase [Hyphomicrobiales bacterium]